MILDFPQAYPADETERRIPDLGAARAWLRGRDSALEALAASVHARFGVLAADPADAALLERSLDALRLAYTRLALRHGGLGDDFHAYHNETHILDICGSRVGRLADAHGLHAFDLRGWCSLLVFGAGHDLRQREAAHTSGGVGANERASSEETQRILDACGFSRSEDADLYLASELTIAGSTFDARPLVGGHFYNAADLVQSGGALAGRLADTLDAQHPGWRADSALAGAQQLALVAADLDTANVAEPFEKFARSGEGLCREREMLSGRSLAASESALPVLRFLTDGQDRFFFELHRFQSELGRSTFESGKQANAGRLKALSMGVRARIALRGLPANGDAVIAAYRDTLAGLL